MTNVLISGYGKMGQMVARLVQEHPNWKVCCGYDAADGFGVGFPIYCHRRQIAGEVNPKPDIIIDFSKEKATEEMLCLATELKIPLVTGTTDLSDLLLSAMKNQTEIPVFQMYNMAPQLKIFTETVCNTATRLKEAGIIDHYDIKVRDLHHRDKAGEISGTAKNLAKAINEALDNEYTIREFPKGKRSDKEIHVYAERGGTTAGTHVVVFESKYDDEDLFEHTHVAHSRALFAKGAIKAAEFLLQQEPGFYTMDDLL